MALSGSQLTRLAIAWIGKAYSAFTSKSVPSVPQATTITADTNGITADSACVRADGSHFCFAAQGLEYTMEGNLLHYTMDDSKLHYIMDADLLHCTMNDNLLHYDVTGRLHYNIEEED